MCGKSWSAWRFTYHYAGACPETIEIPPTNYISTVRRPQISTYQIEEDERSRETEKGLVQNPSKNNLRTAGETKISLELEVKAETTDYFSAKITKGDNCLPYTCLICHISEQTNKFCKTFFFFFLPYCILHIL